MLDLGTRQHARSPTPCSTCRARRTRMRITCPDCATVLKPANPIAAGKKVKCPKCGTVFVVEADDVEAPTKKGKAATAPTAVKKKPADTTKPEKKPAKPPTPATGD